MEALTFIGWMIAGALGIYGVFNRQRKDRQREDDQTATNLITNLKTTTELQEKELIQLRSKEVEQGKQIAHLQGQVKVLSEILQGRDPSMQEFLKRAPDLIVMAKENNGLAKENSQAIVNLTKSITSLVDQMSKKV